MKKVKSNGQVAARNLPVYDVIGLKKAERFVRQDLVENHNTNYYTFRPEGAGSMMAYVYSSDNTIPLLHTAMSVSTPTEKYTVVDLRPYVNKHQEIKNMSDATILYMNSAFEDLWDNEGFATIQSLSEYPIRVYMGMVSKLLNSVYKLEIVDVNLIKIVAGLHAISRVYGKLDKDKLSTIIARYTMIPFDLVYKTITDISETHSSTVVNVDMLASIVKEHGESIKLKKFNGVVLMEQMYKIFYCTGHRQKLAMSVEHWPVWMSLVYAAAEDKRYKRTLLSSYIASTPRSETDIKKDFTSRAGIIVEPYIIDKFLPN